MRLAYASLFVVAGLLAAQSEPDGFEPLAAIARAEKLAARGEVEDAVLLAWQALEAFAGREQHPVRQSAALAAQHLLAEHDPNDEARLEAFAKVARLQAGLVNSYRRKKWYETADGRLAVAERFDRTAAEKERAALDKVWPGAQQEAAADAAPAPAANPLLAPEARRRCIGTWRALDGQGIECAPHEGEEPISEWITSVEHEDHELSAAVRGVDPKLAFNAALWVGYGKPGNGVLVHLLADPAGKLDRVLAYASRDFVYRDLLDTSQARKSAEGEPNRLVVEVRGPRVRVRLDGGEWAEFDAGAPVRGTVGLAVGLGGHASCAVEFRDLRIGPLPEELLALADRYAADGMPRAAQRLATAAAGFSPEGIEARVAAAQAAVDAWNVAQATARAAELQPPGDDGAVLREWFAQGRRLDSRSVGWVVEGPAARVDDLPQGALSAWMPKPGLPPLGEAAVHVRLPARGAAGGFCFDVAGPHDYAIAVLTRRPQGLSLTAFRWRDGKWARLAGKTAALDPWRLDGWFEVAVAAGEQGLQVRGGGMELTVPKALLTAGPRYGLVASSAAESPVTVSFRAFRFTP